MKMFFFSEEEFKKLEISISKKENTKIIQDLIKYKILTPTIFSEEKYLESLCDKIFDGVQIRVMVLHLTDFCNLRCKYCFIEGNIDETYCRNNMSVKVIKKSIDKFLQILQDYKKTASPSIVFYGGEPLANWKTMKIALEYLRKKETRPIDKILITNGTLITDEIARTLKEHNVHVSVSMDGNKQHTDINRVFISGEGSFEKICKGIEVLRKNKIEPSISCVMAKENVSKAEEIIDYFAKDLKIKALGFNHVSIVPDQNYYDEEYEKSFADALIRVQEKIQLEYSDVYERRMNHKINCFLERKLIRADCTGCGEQISVSPTGEIGICQGYMGKRKTFNNSVFDPDYLPKNDPVFKEWSNRSPLKMNSCINCIALATCGGGCPRNADMFSGSIWNPDVPFCHFAKKAQEWMIWQYYDDMVGN